jgi:hypothetical protein
MGRRNYRGTVITLADACAADYLVQVTCERCKARKQMHPWLLIRRREALKPAMLETPLPGFRCTACRRSVRAIVSCTYRRPGDF